jgi:hypothetical protein
VVRLFLKLSWFRAISKAWNLGGLFLACNKFRVVFKVFKKFLNILKIWCFLGVFLGLGEARVVLNS